jgi:hypothetical protein
MKNTKIIVLLSIIVIFLTSCYTLSGQLGASNSIEESKERGVFISEYTVNKNPYPINDSMQITVKKAWLEKSWRYGKNPKKQTSMNHVSGFQLIINSKAEDLTGVDFSWTIGIKVNKCMRAASKEGLIGDFEIIPSDTIIYKVQKGRDLVIEVLPENIIGEFVLYKKNS